MLLPVLQCAPLSYTVRIAHRALDQVQARLLHADMLCLVLLLKSIAACFTLNVLVSEVALPQKMARQPGYLYDFVARLARCQHFARFDVVEVQGVIDGLALLFGWVTCDLEAAKVAHYR